MVRNKNRTTSAHSEATEAIEARTGELFVIVAQVLNAKAVPARQLAHDRVEGRLVAATSAHPVALVDHFGKQLLRVVVVDCVVAPRIRNPK
jgi:hypothetical protein